MFTHLHGHSHYSLLEALGTPGAIIDTVQSHDMSAVALTDYNGMYGAIEFYQKCTKAGLKPIIGVELALVHNHLEMPRDEDAGYIVLLAKNKDGYQALLELTSEANLNGFHEGKARIDTTLLQQHAGNIILLLGGQISYLGKLLLSNEDSGKIKELISGLQDIVRSDNFYLEYVAQYENKMLDLKKINKAVLELSEQMNIPCIATSNFHYVNQSDKEAAEVALAIKDGKRIFDSDKRSIRADRYLMSEDEVRDIMDKNGLDTATIDILVNKTQDVADQIDIQLPMDEILFPKYDSPSEIKELYEQNKENLIEA